MVVFGCGGEGGFGRMCVIYKGDQGLHAGVSGILFGGLGGGYVTERYMGQHGVQEASNFTETE